MPVPGTFEITDRDAATAARCGVLHTAHGPVETPVFMPVGTQGTVKAMDPAELEAWDYRIILGNTFHLHERPGEGLVEDMGGLHRFIGWPHAILTDSGGFQIFSLADLRKVTDEGAAFQSPRDGSRRFVGPVEAMAIQRRLGSDIAMVLDECPPYPCTRESACEAVRRTLKWASLCATQPRAAGQLVFGIVQGGVHEDLREACAAELVRIGFDGYAIGGVSVGEPETLIRQGVEHGIRNLPADRPRYLMGVGLMPQMAEAIARGVDMFDCVMPTRYARNGTAITRRGRRPIKAARYARDERPIEDGCSCAACTRFSRAYVRHLMHAGEILGVRLLTAHNLHRYAEFIREAREAIRAQAYEEFVERVRREYRPRADDPDERTETGDTE